MKTLYDYITEDFTLKKKGNIVKSIDDELLPEPTEFSYENRFEIKQYMLNLIKLIESPLTIKFRDKETNYGDFTIFIYDKSKKSSYLIGYDGYWDKYQPTFETCAKEAIDFIKKY